MAVDSAQKKEAGCYPGFSTSYTCLSAEDRPKSASLPIYFLPHLDKRKPSKISLSATQKSRATNPAFLFPQCDNLLLHQLRANRSLQRWKTAHKEKR
jgi:hypothetical protein